MNKTTQSGKRTRTDRLALGHWVVNSLAPHIRAHGNLEPASEHGPGGWSLRWGTIRMRATHGALLVPYETALSSIVDVWGPEQGTKVLSVHWKPDHPWLPPEVVRVKPGPWLDELQSMLAEKSSR